MAIVAAYPCTRETYTSSHFSLGIFDASATSLKLAVKVCTESVGPSLYLGQFGRWAKKLNWTVSPSIVSVPSCLSSPAVVPSGMSVISLYGTSCTKLPVLAVLLATGLQ
jgi:hypothetical protein